jgi:hypothetical protein
LKAQSSKFKEESPPTLKASEDKSAYTPVFGKTSVYAKASADKSAGKKASEG